MKHSADNEDPHAATFFITRTDKDEPNTSQSVIELRCPARAVLRTDKLDPKLRASIVDSCAMEPIAVTPVILSAEPRLIKRLTDMLDPKFAKLYAEQVAPIRAADARTETDDATDAKSKTDRPKRPPKIPFVAAMEWRAAVRARARTESDEPYCAKLSRERSLPYFPKLRMLSVEPHAAKFITLIPSSEENLTAP
jgi:hypothetical protein